MIQHRSCHLHACRKQRQVEIFDGKKEKKEILGRAPRKSALGIIVRLVSSISLNQKPNRA